MRLRRRVFAQGVLVNAFNPKVALFFLAFLPQFVDPDAAHPALQIGLLGLVFVAIALVLDLGWALTADAAGGLLRRSRSFLRAPALCVRGRLRRPSALRLPSAPRRVERLTHPPPYTEIGSSSVTSSPDGISASSRSRISSAPGAAARSRRSTSSVDSSRTSSCLNGLGNRP